MHGLNREHAATAPSRVDLSSPRRLVVAPRDIPCLPANIDRLRRLAASNEASPAALERAIAADLGFTTRVLAAANSPFYGCSGQIDSIRGAITLLGATQIRAIARALAEAPPWECPHAPALWLHALATAQWTRVITRHLQLPDVPYLFTAGMMHDIGLILLLRKIPEIASTFVELTRDRRGSWPQLEQERVRPDHSVIAAQACRAWQLPETLVRTIASHHRHEDGNLEGSVLMLADALAQAIGFGEFADLPRLSRDEIAAMVELNTDIEELLAQGPRVRQDVEAISGAVS